ncbi:MAG: hypothetical protein WB626_08445, partial [Bacteroidota bacterium]
FTPDPVRAWEDESQEEPELRVGARVVHETFGRGRITALEGRGEQKRVTVEFESVGRKLLLHRFAHLRPG